MNYPILKRVECTGEYNEASHSYEVYDIPIHAIPINKKNFCRPVTTMEGKAGTKTINLCKNAPTAKTCNICVATAKQIFKMNNRG
jgi:hypothetical protein